MDEVLGAFGDGPMIKRLNVAGHTMNDYENFKNLILAMLEFDAKERIGPLQALQHPFFKTESIESKSNSIRTPTSTTNQNNREFQTIPLATMLAERSQLERSTLEHRMASDDKDAYQYDLLNKYKLFKSPGKQVSDLDRFRYEQLSDQPTYYLYQQEENGDQIAQQNILNRTNGERLAFDLSQPHHTTQNAFYTQSNNFSAQNAYQTGSYPNEDIVDSKRFRKQQLDHGSLIDFSMGSSLITDSTVDLNSLPYSDGMHYGQLTSGNHYTKGNNGHYNDVYDKVNFKSSRLDFHQPQTISTTISGLNLLDPHLQQPDDRSMKHVHKALSSSIGNLNLLNNQYRFPLNYLGHHRNSDHILNPYPMVDNTKRKSYANEYWFK